MHEFLQRHEKDVTGMLSGFDRVRLRGTLRFLAHTQGMWRYLCWARVLLKDFTAYAKGITERIRTATEAIAQAAGRPLLYVASSAMRKDRLARQLMLDHGVTAGLICVLSCVEPCWSYRVRGNRRTQRLELRGEQQKCLHYYFYYQDPVRGLLHVRLQRWFPFTVHVCLNGREWLAQQLRQAGIGYTQRENCIVDVADVDRAQRLLTAQVQQRWEPWLNELVARVHPQHAQIFRQVPLAYYWSADETEWASDVLFRSRERLGQLYPSLLTHGLHSFGSPDVLRFLGHKVQAHPHATFKGEVLSSFRARPEGIRLKHWVNRNSVKLYDKQGTVLRVETTINDARDLRTLLYSPPTCLAERRRHSAQITRQLRILRAHGIIKKIPKTHRYMLTRHGRLLSCALAAARRANTEQLTKLAA